MSRLSLTKNLRILLAFGTSNAPTAGIISCVGTGSHAPGRGLKLSFRSRFNADEGDLPRSGKKLSIEETLCKYDIFLLYQNLTSCLRLVTVLKILKCSIRSRAELL
jgi:hypothetical protein